MTTETTNSSVSDLLGDTASATATVTEEAAPATPAEPKTESTPAEPKAEKPAKKANGKAKAAKPAKAPKAKKEPKPKKLVTPKILLKNPEIKRNEKTGKIIHIIGTCTWKGCDKTRKIHAADAFQVRYCKEHKLEAAKLARSKAAKVRREKSKKS